MDWVTEHEWDYAADWEFTKTADLFGEPGGEYQGWTNWDTWHTKLMMDNERELYDKQQKMAEEGWSPEQIRDWALKHVLGPHNKQAIEDAQDWNSIPEDERVDHHWEDLNKKSPEAADLVDQLGFGKDVSDTEPQLMDPELVNWDEIHQHINDEHSANDDYEREMQALQDRGLGWGTNHPDEINQMRDAMYRLHGAVPEHELDAEGAKYNDPRAYHNRKVTVPGDHFEQMAGPHWPENYMSLDARNKAWDLRHQQGRSNYDDIDWSQPGFAEIANQDPDIQGIRQNGYTQSLSDYTHDLIHSIQKGQAHPYHAQQMQQALQQRGYTPEEIAQITRQQRAWDPVNQQWNNLDPPPPPQPPDPTLDQPGTMTLPEGWTASNRDLDVSHLGLEAGEHRVAFEAQVPRPEIDQLSDRDTIWIFGAFEGVHSFDSSGFGGNDLHNLRPQSQQPSAPVADHGDALARCEACGDPLVEGECRRCDWGPSSWGSDAATSNPSDPVKDLKSPFQSHVRPPKPLLPLGRVIPEARWSWPQRVA